VPDDVRITTRYDESDAAGAIMAVLHETGHALYEKGLPPAWRDQPVGRALGSSVTAAEMLERATGKPLDAGVFKAHLRRRYVEGVG